MTKFHVDPHGTPGRCTAQEGNCLYGENSPHFASAQEAREFYEEHQEFVRGLKKSVHKAFAASLTPADIAALTVMLEAVRDEPESLSQAMIAGTADKAVYTIARLWSPLNGEINTGVVSPNVDGDKRGSAWINDDPRIVKAWEDFVTADMESGGKDYPTAKDAFWYAHRSMLTPPVETTGDKEPEYLTGDKEFDAKRQRDRLAGW